MSTRSKMSILHDGKMLAKLKYSIGKDHAEPRPLYPIYVAKALQEMKTELDDKTNTEISHRLGVSKSIISDLHNLLKVPSKYDGGLGSPRYVELFLTP